MATTTYSTGTISVGAGSTSVTGVNTAWSTSGVRAGDILIAAGLTGIIASVNSTTSITLKRAWPGAALTGANYDIDYRDDGVRSLAAANQLLQTLTNGTLTSFAALASAANKLPYFNGANSFAMTDLTPAARAVLGLSGAAGAKIPVVTGASTAVLRDILGTAAMTSGVPTGALIERGTNANGEYVRFADGTQICTRSVEAQAVSSASTVRGIYRTAALDYTFPAAFSASGIISGGISFSPFESGLIAQCRASTNWRVVFGAPATFTDLGISAFTLFAVGRWV